MDQDHVPRPLRAPVDPPFKFVRQFNCPDGRADAGKKHRLTKAWMFWFTGDTMLDRLAHALADAKAISMKEFVESLEFFHRVRRAVRGPVVADLCCGHGLTGLLFALLERQVDEVWLVDRVHPPAQARVVEAICSLGDWVERKLRRVEAPLSTLSLPAGAGVLGVHACGAATDGCLAHGIKSGGPVAVMPCCYGRAVPSGPPAVHAALGKILSADVDRTYRLEQAGYRVQWSAIPRSITPMNRILIARKAG
jgi:hypothetical protein